MKHTLQISGPEDGIIKGRIALNGSKSISNRVLIIQALCHNHFNIENLSTAMDTVTLAKSLPDDDGFVDAGAGGTTYRFLTAYLATQSYSTILTGSDRMKERPIGILVDALRSLGAEIEYLEEEGYPPLKIQGGLKRGGKVSISADTSSQFLTALLLIAPALEGGLELSWEGELVSKPYVSMTLNLMEHFGASCSFEKNCIKVKEGHYEPHDFYVEGDWSAASYYYSIAAMATEADIELVGLDAQSVQGDSVIAFMMQSLGVESTFDIQHRLVRLTKKHIILPKGFSNDFLECPDLAQTLVATMTGLRVDGQFSGIQTLKIKETDRVAAMAAELAKFKASFTEFDQENWVLNTDQVSKPEHRPIIETYEDHRMAMAIAPLCLPFGPLIIENPVVVEKSYPMFWEDLAELGFRVS